MFWLMAALLVGYGLLLPVTLTLSLEYQETARTDVSIHFATLHKSWTFSGLPRTSAAFRQSRRHKFFSALHHADAAKSFLLQHTHLVRLDALILLHTGDAARTALLTGALRSVLMAALPHQKVRIALHPDFFHAHSAINIRCIIRWKLGILLLTAWLLLTEMFLQQQPGESEA